MGEHDTMNRYRTKLFEVQHPDGKHAGEFVAVKDYEDLNDWIQGEVEKGCTLKSIQPVTAAHCTCSQLWSLSTWTCLDPSSSRSAPQDGHRGRSEVGRVPNYHPTYQTGLSVLQREAAEGQPTRPVRRQGVST